MKFTLLIKLKCINHQTKLVKAKSKFKIFEMEEHSNFRIQQAKEFVKELMQNNDPSHDWYHVQRVFNNALYIAEKENELNDQNLEFDLEVIQLAALFHDIVDFKYDFKESKSLDEIAKDRLSPFFKRFSYPKEKIDTILFIVLNISWRKELESSDTFELPIELKIVRDADRLESIGAIGISRCMAYTGALNRPIYVDGSEPNRCMSAEQYNKQTIENKSIAINYFYEKLLLIKDRMQTKTGKELAIQRHKFMVTFLEQFDLELIKPN
jgi:uncharacterized protein